MSDAVIATRGLTKDFGEGRGLFALDLEVARGEVMGSSAPTAPARPPP
jgi:ABC-2 type transport system ATP-binding protein